MDTRTALIIIHIIGTTLGAGAATVSDYLFFKFAKDGKLDKDEFRILKTVSELVWIGLLLLVLSGLGFVLLYLFKNSDVQRSYSLDKIWAKLIIVIILLCNGFVMHRKVLPLFARRLGKSFATPQFIKHAPIIFTAGAISGVSWYSALILGAWRGLSSSTFEILGIYAVIIFCAVITSNTIGRKLLNHLIRKRTR